MIADVTISAILDIPTFIFFEDLVVSTEFSAASISIEPISVLTIISFLVSMSDPIIVADPASIIILLAFIIEAFEVEVIIFSSLLSSS